MLMDASHACGLRAPAGSRPRLKLNLLCGQFDLYDLRRTIVAHRQHRASGPGARVPLHRAMKPMPSRVGPRTARVEERGTEQRKADLDAMRVPAEIKLNIP